MRHPLRNALYIIIGTGWAVGVAIGGWKLWGFDATAGTPAKAQAMWPAEAQLARRAALPALVLLVHPHCPCSRATIGELARLTADGHGKLTATVVMLRPADSAEGWEQTDLWRSAAAIPGVTVVPDVEGRESKRFGAATSGQTLLYAADGRLLFNGGITESRGHSGDNAGRSAILALVLDPKSAPSGRVLSTPVYGCPLFDESACTRGGDQTCPK
jgi:hypothetical protein